MDVFEKGLACRLGTIQGDFVTAFTKRFECHWVAEVFGHAAGDCPSIWYCACGRALDHAFRHNVFHFRDIEQLKQDRLSENLLLLPLVDSLCTHEQYRMVEEVRRNVRDFRRRRLLQIWHFLYQLT